MQLDQNRLLKLTHIQELMPCARPVFTTGSSVVYCRRRLRSAEQATGNILTLLLSLKKWGQQNEQKK
jgi:hypothetical protein